jgi:hypothetical protein
MNTVRRSRAAMLGHVRSIDTVAQPIVYAGRVPAAILEDARSKSAALKGL